jgi:radical SAM-linked protein
LPVGLESEGETLVMTVTADAGPNRIMEALNRQLPEGITIKACRTLLDSGRKKEPERKALVYHIHCAGEVFDPGKAERFSMADRLLMEKPNKDGLKKSIDLKEIVTRLSVLDRRHIQLEVNDLPGKKARPADIVGAVFGLDEETIKRVRIVKALMEQ